MSDQFSVFLCARVREIVTSTHTNPHPALGGGGVGGPGGNFCLDESFLGLKVSLYPEFQLPMCLATGLKVCVVVVS